MAEKSDGMEIQLHKNEVLPKIYSSVWTMENTIDFFNPKNASAGSGEKILYWM